VDGALRAALRDLTIADLGRWLRAMRDRPLAGYVVQRVTRDRHGAVWTVLITDHQHHDPGV
jgi:hypothetical protein